MFHLYSICFWKKCTYLFLFCKLCSVSLLLLFFVFWYCFASFFVCFCLLLCLCSYSVWACFFLLLLLLLSFLSCFLVLPGKYEVLSMQVNLKCFFGDWNGLNALDHFAPYLLMFPVLLDHIFASMSLIFFCFCVQNLANEVKVLKIKKGSRNEAKILQKLLLLNETSIFDSRKQIIWYWGWFLFKINLNSIKYTFIICFFSFKGNVFKFNQKI